MFHDKTLSIKVLEVFSIDALKHQTTCSHSILGTSPTTYLNWLKNSQVSAAAKVWLAPLRTGVWICEPSKVIHVTG